MKVSVKFYLKPPATVRRAIKRDKPNHNPRRPKTEGAYSKIDEEAAPTAIYR